MYVCVCVVYMFKHWVPVSPVQVISMILTAEPSSSTNSDTCTQSKYMLAVCPSFSSLQIQAAVILFYMPAQMLMNHVFNHLTISDISLSVWLLELCYTASWLHIFRWNIIKILGWIVTLFTAGILVCWKLIQINSGESLTFSSTSRSE